MYKYELHMHTSEGSACGRASVDRMIKRFWELGFSGAAVTNHFIGGNTAISRELPWEDFVEQYSRAYFEGQSTAKKLGFDLLFGIEQGYGGGKEFLAYGFEPQFLTERPFLRNADIKLWAQEIHSVGGFIAYAHPFRDRPYIKNPNEVPDLSIVDGVECYNFCNRPEDNEKAKAEFSSADTVMIAGSDLHNDDFEDAFGILLPQRVSTGAELAAALKENNFELYLGKR